MRSIVYYYTHVEHPFEVLSDVLSSDPGVWLPTPATPIDGSDGAWLVHVRAEGALPGLVAGHPGHPTEVRVGPPATSDVKVLRSIAWRSTTAERLVPVLEADLELVPLTGYGCQLSLMGSYRPPLAVVGEVGDRLVGHRVAEACVRRFVLDTAERLESALQQT